MTFEEFKKDVEKNSQKYGATAYIIVLAKHNIGNFGRYLPIEVINETSMIYMCGKSTTIFYKDYEQYLENFHLRIKSIARITEEIIELCES